MKKIYKTPEISLIVWGEEMMAGLNQNSVGADATLPDGTGVHDGGESDPGDDPGAKSFNVWDDWAEEVEEEE